MKIVRIPPPHEIVYLSGDGNYSWIHIKNGTSKIYSKTMGNFETMFPEFIRLHKTRIVNPLYVAGWVKEGPKVASVTLKDGVVIQVSRRRISAVLKQLSRVKL